MPLGPGQGNTGIDEARSGSAETLAFGAIEQLNAYGLAQYPTSSSRRNLSISDPE
jgi:hypothetical protein